MYYGIMKHVSALTTLLPYFIYIFNTFPITSSDTHVLQVLEEN